MSRTTTRPHPRRGRWRPAVLAAWLVLGIGLGGPLAGSPAQAQGSRQAGTAPQITGFDVQPAERLQPGAELPFTLWGTPGATATLDIAGAVRPLHLREGRPGVYDGVYTLSGRDRVAPDAAVVASLRRGNQLSRASLAEPLQRGWQATPAAASDRGPVIERFAVTQAGQRRAGHAERVLLLRVDGSPGARVWALLPGAANRRIRLTEDSPGVYTARYTVGDADHLSADAAATAVMRLGGHRADSSLPHALAGVPLPPAPRRQQACAECGTVLAVNRLQVEGEGAPLGAVAGGVLGAVLGSQFGQGDGRTAAGVAGAVAGGVLGHQVDRRRLRHEQFEVLVRMSDGSQRSVDLDADPGLRKGDLVRVIDGKLQPGHA